MRPRPSRGVGRLRPPDSDTWTHSASLGRRITQSFSEVAETFAALRYESKSSYLSGV